MLNILKSQLKDLVKLILEDKHLLRLGMSVKRKQLKVPIS